MNIKMGKVYWRVNNTTDTFESLKSLLENLGIVAVSQKPLGDEYGFKRVIDWITPTGLQFSTIWHVNLCNIRFGQEFENDIAEIIFDEIRGSYVPYYEHDTIDFTYKGNTMFRLALKSEVKNSGA